MAKSIAVVLVATLLAVPLAATADDTSGEAQRMEALENRLMALEDELKATRGALESSEEMRKQGVSAADVEAGSGLDAFLSGVQIGGYVEASYIYNWNNPEQGTGTDAVGGQPGTSPQPHFQFNRNHNTFELDAVKFELGKPASEPGSAGFQVDLLFGANNHILCGEGLYEDTAEDAEEFTVTQNADDGVCIQEAYVAYNWDGYEINFGKFETLLGYEVIDAPYNNHVSHGVLFTWSIPLVHNGVLVKGNLTEQIGFAAGVTNGFNNITDQGDNKGVLGSLSFEDGPLFASFNVFVGSEDFSASSSNPPFTSKGTTSHDVQIYDLIVTYAVSDDLGLWANADYGRLDRSRNTTVVGGPFGASTRTDPRWWGVAGGFTYDINEKVNFAMRGEYFFDDGGSRLYTAFGTTPRSETRMTTGTATLSYALTNNLTARLEYRHDRVSGQAGDPFPNERDGCAGSTNLCQDSIDLGIVEVNYQFD